MAFPAVVIFTGRRLAAIALIILGFYGGLSGCAVQNGLIGVGTNDELPLADVNSVAVDSVGVIYCASVYYGRIQRYDSHGKFLSGWLVNAHGGFISLRVNQADQLEVYLDRGGELLTFDAGGRATGRLRVARSDAGHFNGLQAVTPQRDALTLQHRFFAPRLVRTTGDGSTRTLVSTSPFETLTMPVPSWFLLVAASFLWQQRRITGRRRRQPLSEKPADGPRGS